MTIYIYKMKNTFLSLYQYNSWEAYSDIDKS